MPKTIAIFGAGPGLGLGASVARRFAGEGFHIALIARNKDHLNALVDQLAAEGIEAAGFTADLAAPDEIPALITAIRDRFGRIDVIEYGPIPRQPVHPRRRTATRHHRRGHTAARADPIGHRPVRPAGVDPTRRRRLPDDHRRHHATPHPPRKRPRPADGRSPQLALPPPRRSPHPASTPAPSRSPHSSPEARPNKAPPQPATPTSPPCRASTRPNSPPSTGTCTPRATTSNRSTRKRADEQRALRATGTGESDGRPPMHGRLPIALPSSFSSSTAFIRRLNSVPIRGREPLDHNG